MSTRLAAAAMLAALAVPAPAHAWGFAAHKYIMARAITLLPGEIRPYFEAHRDVIVERVIDPDLWRIAGDEAENPHHVVYLDAYGPYPFKDLSHDYDALVKKHGTAFVVNNGTLPWRTDEMFKKLVAAFMPKSSIGRDNIQYFAAWVSHYVGDAHVPFHAARNSDGQLTGQHGIHARFETALFERYRDRLRVSPGSLVTIGNPRERMFEALLASFPLVEPILAADRAAAKGRALYDDEYFALMLSTVRPILEQRLADAVVDTASVITAAWTAAGRPPLPRETPQIPRKTGGR